MYGWLNTSLKSTETRDKLLITLYQQSEINLNVPSQCLMLHPYITTSRTIINIVLHLELNSGIGEGGGGGGGGCRGKDKAKYIVHQNSV